jgi:RnfABCDGE-type electron transport complex B subunit
MNTILISLLAMGGLGLFLAGVLAFASEKMRVEEDPRVEQILQALPGLNCGACGFAGCFDLAQKIAAQGNLDGLRCPPGGAATEETIAGILGIAAKPEIRKRAVVKCGGGKGLAAEKAEYQGINTCAAAELVAGGSKACSYGCLSFGDCEKACPFDAIHIKKDGLPSVDELKCTACGLCVAACPRKIIELVPCANRVVVNCNSKDKGVVVRKICKVGCIACLICVKTAPDAYRIEDNLARVLYEKGDAAAEPAIQKCPTKCIVKIGT